MQTLCCNEKSPLVVEVVDLSHVAEQNVLLVLEADGDEVHHAGVVHLISITLEHTHVHGNSKLQPFQYCHFLHLSIIRG